MAADNVQAEADAAKAARAEEKPLRLPEKIILGALGIAAMGTGLYFGLGYVGSLVINNRTSLELPLTIDGSTVRYEEQLPADSFWRHFPFVDKNGKAVLTIMTPEGGLVARITDNDNNGTVGSGDVVEVRKEVDGISGIIAYHGNKAVDSDGKTEFTKPSTVLQAQILQQGRQERARWNSWLQAHLPEIKAKLQQQQQYR